MLYRGMYENIDRGIFCGRFKNFYFCFFKFCFLYKNEVFVFFMYWRILIYWKDENIINFFLLNYYLIENLILFCFFESCIVKYNDGDKKKFKRIWKFIFIINIFICINWLLYIYYIYIWRFEENLIFFNRIIIVYFFILEFYILELCFIIVVLMIISMYIVFLFYIFIE